MTSKLNYKKEPKSKKQKSSSKNTSPTAPEYDFSKENIDLCLNTLLASLKAGGMTEKANVIEKTFKSQSDKLPIKLNNIVENKKTKENIIPCDQAAALIVYLNLTRREYQCLKNFTDNLGIGFLPTWANCREERKQCLADDLKCDESEATASIRATLKKWLDRAMIDPEVREPCEKLKKEFPAIKFKLLYKLGKWMLQLKVIILK